MSRQLQRQAADPASPTGEREQAEPAAPCAQVGCLAGSMQCTSRQDIMSIGLIVGGGPLPYCGDADLC